MVPYPTMKMLGYSAGKRFVAVLADGASPMPSTLTFFHGTSRFGIEFARPGAVFF
jgi:hypothetical protein